MERKRSPRSGASTIPSAGRPAITSDREIAQNGLSRAKLIIARRGGGAYLNGAGISVAEVTGLREAIVGVADFKVGVGSEEENRVHLAVLARLARESLRVRMLGSAALTSVAGGWAAERYVDAVRTCRGM